MFSKTRETGLGVLLAVILGGAPLRALDTIETAKSGRQIQGTFQSATAEHVVFELDSDIAVTIPWKSIRSLKLAETIQVQSSGKQNGITLVSPEIDVGADDLLIRNSPEILPLASLVSISVGPAGASPKAGKTVVVVSATPKFNLAYGTQSVQTVSGSAALRVAENVTLETPQHQETVVTLDANNTLTEQAGSPSIRMHEYDGAFHHLVFLAGGFYGEAIAEGFHNSAFNLYLEQSYGGGVGKRFHNRRASLDVGGGMLYVAEHFIGSTGPKFAAARVSEELSITLKSLKAGPVVLAVADSYLPAIDQSKAWQVRGTVQLRIPFSKNFSFTSGFLDDYLENAPNARKNYSTTSAGINFSLSPK